MLVWTGAENLAPTEVRSQTLQLVSSRYYYYYYYYYLLECWHCFALVNCDSSLAGVAQSV